MASMHSQHSIRPCLSGVQPVASTSGRSCVVHAPSRRFVATLASAAAASGARVARSKRNKPVKLPDCPQPLDARGMEVIKILTPWAEAELLPRFAPPARCCWHASDVLPDAAAPDFARRLSSLRADAAALPNDLLVAVAGGAAVKGAAAARFQAFARADGGVGDETGAQPHVWARWSRAWVADEQRHARALQRYLYLCGRADSGALERTTQRLIGAGDGAGGAARRNPYALWMGAALAERADAASWASLARLAGYHGDTTLAALTARVGADDARHGAAFEALVSRLFERDAAGAVVALAALLRRGHVRPGVVGMDDGWHARANANNSGGGGGGGASTDAPTALYSDYAAVVDALGVFTTADHATAVEALVGAWRVGELRFGGGGDDAEAAAAAAAAQEYVCRHAEQARRLADLQTERRLRDRRAGRAPAAAFSWVYKREVPLT